MTNFEHFLINYLLKYRNKIVINTDAEEDLLIIYNNDIQYHLTADINVVNSLTVDVYMTKYIDPFLRIMHENEVPLREHNISNDTALINTILELIRLRNSSELLLHNANVSIDFDKRNCIEITHGYVVNGEICPSFFVGEVYVHNDRLIQSLEKFKDYTYNYL